MRLYEFDQEHGGAMVSRIVALTNQLKQDLHDGKLTKDFNLDNLLAYFQRYDIILDKHDLYNMIKVPPLKSLIKNIQGKKVVFVGQKEDKVSHKKNDDSKDTVKKMAKHARRK